MNLNNNEKLERIKKIQILSESNEPYVALHGTSFKLIETLVESGKIAEEGNFDNYFYLLKHSDEKSVNIEESALFYAKVNSVKDLIKEKLPDIFNKIYENNFDPYMYTISIDLLLDPLETTTPKYFDFLSDNEIKSIRDLIIEAKNEKRKGVILKFAEKLFQDFEFSELPTLGQTKIFLSKPITIDYLSSMELVGDYEKNQLQELANNF